MSVIASGPCSTTREVGTVGYLSTVSEAGASADVQLQYDADRARFGYVANYTKAFSPRPTVYAAWQQLNAAVKAGMSPRRYEVATLAAARRLRSSYCALAHGQVLAERHIGEQAVRELMSDPVELVDSVLDSVDLAVADLAATVADDAQSITEADFAALRTLGLSDPEILDVILAAAARCFFSTVLDATGTRPDAAFSALLDPATREALTVGRPIDDP